MRLVYTFLHVVDDGIIEHACVLVVLLDIDVYVFYAIIEYTFRNVQLWRFCLHGEEHLLQVLLRIWHNFILKIKRSESK